MTAVPACPNCENWITASRQNDRVLDQLRRDLATRDRELAEARAAFANLKACADHDEIASTQIERELSQARAALADKDEEHLACIEHMQAEFAKTMKQALDDRDAARAELTERRAGWGGLLDLRAAQLAAAQEEAKGLRAALEQIRDVGCTGIASPPSCACRSCIATRALAARQQQPDGKPDPAPVASETCSDCLGRKGHWDSLGHGYTQRFVKCEGCDGCGMRPRKDGP